MARTPTPIAAPPATIPITDGSATAAPSAPSTPIVDPKTKSLPPGGDDRVAVRVLRDHGDLMVNSVALIEPAALDAAIEDGWADPHPDAVAYARGLSA